MGSTSKEPSAEQLPHGVFEVPGEPAVVINGVPNVGTDPDIPSYDSMATDTQSNLNHWSGEWMEGREVKKLFGEKYYLGKVMEFDHETNWYRVVYEDGDFEDLEWDELKDVRTPLDISIPVRELSLKILKHKVSVSKTKQGGAKSNTYLDVKRKRKGETMRSNANKGKRGGPKGKSKSIPEGLCKRGRPKTKNIAATDGMHKTGKLKGKSMVIPGTIRKRGRPKGSKKKFLDGKTAPNDDANACKKDKIEPTPGDPVSVDGVCQGKKLTIGNTGGMITAQSDNTPLNAGDLSTICEVDAKRNDIFETN